MSEKSRAKKLAAAKKKLKEYHGSRNKKDLNETNGNNHYIDNMLQKNSNEEENKIEQTDVLSHDVDSNLPERKLHANEHSDVIETLVLEKASIIAQLVKLETLSKGKDMEIEELNIKLSVANKRIENLETSIIEKTTENDQLKVTVTEIQNELSKTEGYIKMTKLQREEQADYIEEIKNKVNAQQQKIEELESQLKEKTYELELNKIQLNQLSDETHVTIDNKIENLMQSKFAYEQEIANLQDVIEQLGKEKEDSNQQYQNYIQNLSKKLSTLTEKNVQLKEENAKLLDREQNLVQHIQELEKQIQRGITKQSVLESTDYTKKISILEDNISKIEKERTELFSSLKSNETKLIEMNTIVQEKEKRILELEEEIKNFNAHRPNDEKILATIESSKIAASRAVTQNEELKKQLNEIEMKLIQVTNEKAELVQSLQAEQHSNKEARLNYDYLKESVNKLNEQLRFKDEEMIRLTHENSNLNKEVQQLKQLNNHISFTNNEDKETNMTNDIPKVSSHENSLENSNHHEIECDFYKNSCTEESNDLPQKEAMHKLEERLRKLMDKVADLSDEKQNLEHLVLQLQGETETIGDYITLYQTQRRILKQKEIERNLQIQKLITEREAVKQKGLQLVNLINKFNGSAAKADNLENNIVELFSPQQMEVECDKLLTDIQNILIDINKNQNNDDEQLKVSLDHCACCSGKFETV